MRRLLWGGHRLGRIRDDKLKGYQFNRGSTLDRIIGHIVPQRHTVLPVEERGEEICIRLGCQDESWNRLGQDLMERLKFFFEFN